MTSPRRVEPLDPDSPKGRQVRADLSRIFAEVALAIAARQRAKHDHAA